MLFFSCPSSQLDSLRTRNKSTPPLQPLIAVSSTEASAWAIGGCFCFFGWYHVKNGGISDMRPKCWKYCFFSKNDPTRAICFRGPVFSMQSHWALGPWCRLSQHFPPSLCASFFFWSWPILEWKEGAMIHVLCPNGPCIFMYFLVEHGFPPGTDPPGRITWLSLASFCNSSKSNQGFLLPCCMGRPSNDEPMESQPGFKRIMARGETERTIGISTNSTQSLFFCVCVCVGNSQKTSYPAALCPKENKNNLPWPRPGHVCDLQGG